MIRRPVPLNAVAVLVVLAAIPAAAAQPAPPPHTIPRPQIRVLPPSEAGRHYQLHVGLPATQKEQGRLPFIRIEPGADPSYRVLGGASLGGLFTLYTMPARPTLLAGYIAVTPAVVVGNDWLLGYEGAFAKSDRRPAGRGQARCAGIFPVAPSSRWETGFGSRLGVRRCCEAALPLLAKRHLAGSHCVKLLVLRLELRAALGVVRVRHDGVDRAHLRALRHVVTPTHSVHGQPR